MLNEEENVILVCKKMERCHSVWEGEEDMQEGREITQSERQGMKHYYGARGVSRLTNLYTLKKGVRERGRGVRDRGRP